MIDAKKVRKILSKNILADGFTPIMDLEKSKGSYIVDQATGDSYLDMFSMFASGSIGYNHPNILKNKKLLTSVSLIISSGSTCIFKVTPRFCPSLYN